MVKLFGLDKLKDYKSIFAGKRITVMGLGLLGRGLNDTLFLIECGAEVTVTDLKSPGQLASSLKKLEGLPVRIKVGGHDPVDFVETDMVLRNADVPLSSPFLKLARDHRVPIEMDESLFCKYFKGYRHWNYWYPRENHYNGNGFQGVATVETRSVPRWKHNGSCNSAPFERGQ